jgi:hypothetical protein
MKKLVQLGYKILAALALLGLVVAIYLFLARPYQLHWGATRDEIGRPMPGDELDPKPMFLATRAITINATPEEIWPWLMQMGYGRAGFYGYDIIENIGSKRGMRSADRIIPELQHFKVGDDLPLSAAGGLVFYAIEPNRYLIWTGPDGWGAFTWALYPLDENHTRLVSRILWTHHWNQPSQLGMDIFTEFTDHLAVRKILQGIKGRVEGNIEPMAQGNIEFFYFLVSAVMLFISVVLILIRPLSWQRWLIGLIAGIVWLVTWYAPISIWLGVLLELGVLSMLIGARTSPLLRRLGNHDHAHFSTRTQA